MLKNVNDIIGRVFRNGDHWFKVIREVDPRRKPDGSIKSRRYECLCKCGETFITNRCSILNGDTKSCGCLRKQNVLKRQIDIEALRGEKYGISDKEVTLLYEIEQKILSDGTPRRMVRCGCHCGKEFDADFHNLKAGRILSCGCLQHQRDNSFFGKKHGDDTSYVIPIRDAEDQIINGIPKRMVLCQCSCGNEFAARKDMVISGRTRSCGCRVGEPSLGELRLEELLEENDFDFKKQHPFSTCVNPETNRKLKFDFYVPHYGMLIEYDGDQHFRESRGFDKEPISMRVYRDQLKDNWCMENNIPLLRIPYTEYKHLDWEYLNNAMNLTLKNAENGKMLTFMNPELYANREASNNCSLEIA